MECGGGGGSGDAVQLGSGIKQFFGFGGEWPLCLCEVDGSGDLPARRTPLGLEASAVRAPGRTTEASDSFGRTICLAGCPLRNLFFSLPLLLLPLLGFVPCGDSGGFSSLAFVFLGLAAAAFLSSSGIPLLEAGFPEEMVL